MLARGAPGAVQVIIPKADQAEKHRQVSSSTRASCSFSSSSLSSLFSGRIGDNDTATVAFSSVLARVVLIKRTRVCAPGAIPSNACQDRSNNPSSLTKVHAVKYV